MTITLPVSLAASLSTTPVIVTVWAVLYVEDVNVSLFLSAVAMRLPLAPEMPMATVTVVAGGGGGRQRNRERVRVAGAGLIQRQSGFRHRQFRDCVIVINGDGDGIAARAGVSGAGRFQPQVVFLIVRIGI